MENKKSIKQRNILKMNDWLWWRWLRKLPEYILLGITLGLVVVGAIKVVVAFVAILIGFASLAVKRWQWWRW